MNDNKSFILHGAESYYETPNTSLGIQFLISLRKRSSDDVVYIDAATAKVLTCGKLIENSIKLASAFKDIGLKHGDVLCLVCENSINYYVPVLAAFYIGVNVALINPEYTLTELRHSFQFYNSKVVICSNLVIKNIIQLQEEKDCISHVILSSDEENDLDLNLKSLRYYIETITVDIDTFQPEDLNASETGAFIYLSSGTTGLPKGVLLTHKNMAVTITNLSDPRYTVIKPEDRILTVLPFFHMFGSLIGLMTMAMPITTVVINKFRPETYLRAVQEYQPSKLIVVPPLLMFFTTSPLVDNYNVSSVKECICSGATVAKPFLATIKQRFPSLDLRQMYGITETGGFCLINVPNSKDETVGIPIPNVQVKVRNPETFQPLGPFEPGELCFKGPMIMKGYIGNISATQNAMDKDGFFCSGDIAYYDDENFFFIVGRQKEIIKYKGFQVSPNELEELLLTHPDVKDCAVVGLQHERNGELPLAFIVRKSECLTEEEIINYVAERISVHKRLYGGVRFIDEIPKSPAGKILRLTLKKLL